MDDAQLQTVWQQRQFNDRICPLSQPLHRLMKYTLAKRVRRLQDLAVIWDDVIPCLEAAGLTVLGVMPKVPILHSVSVAELAEATEAEFLCGEDEADELVEHFVVGAMGVEQALQYFRRTPRKCVITGGDRSDI